MRLRATLCGWLVAVVVMFTVPGAFAHASKKMHADEIQQAFGFEHPDVYAWLCFISSDMIDKHQPFYDQLTAQFPGFKCRHRLLFHWNFNGKPWTPGLEKRVAAYTRQKYGSQEYKEHLEEMNAAFLEALRKEQKRRNGLINARTEELFGFASGGREASYANFFAAMAYDLHLLGDYMTDNKDLNGLVELNTLVGGIISTINRLDAKQGKVLTKALSAELKTDKGDQEKADALMAIVQDKLPGFIRSAREGYIYNHLRKRGFKFN